MMTLTAVSYCTVPKIPSINLSMWRFNLCIAIYWAQHLYIPHYEVYVCMKLNFYNHVFTNLCNSRTYCSYLIFVIYYCADDRFCSHDLQFIAFEQYCTLSRGWQISGVLSPEIVQMVPKFLKYILYILYDGDRGLPPDWLASLKIAILMITFLSLPLLRTP